MYWYKLTPLDILMLRETEIEARRLRTKIERQART